MCCGWRAGADNKFQEEEACLSVRVKATSTPVAIPPPSCTATVWQRGAHVARTMAPIKNPIGGVGPHFQSVWLMIRRSLGLAFVPCVGRGRGVGLGGGGYSIGGGGYPSTPFWGGFLPQIGGESPQKMGIKFGVYQPYGRGFTLSTSHDDTPSTGGGGGWPASPVATGCQGNPCSTGIRWGVSPAAQMGCLCNRSGSPSGADQP